MPDLHEHYCDLRDLRLSIADLAASRESFLLAIRRHSDGDDFAEIEQTGLELLRQVEIAERKLRCSLSVIKLLYASLWVRRSVRERATEAPLDAPGDGPYEKVLEETEQFILKRLEDTDRTFAGGSEEAGIRVTVDKQMKLVELELETSRLDRPGYRASLIEAVNAGIAPAFASCNALHDTLFGVAAPEPDEVPSPWDIERPDPTLCLEAHEDLLAAKGEFGNKLPGIASVDDLEHLEDVARCVSDAEQGLDRHIPSLVRIRSLLEAKVDLPRVKSADLAEVEDVRQVFLAEDLNPPIFPPGMQDKAGIARHCLEAAAAEIEELEAEKESWRSWQSVTVGIRRQLAEVERQTFEGHSQDGLVTASVTGRMELVDLEIRTEPAVEPLRIRADLIEAINQALSAGFARRGLASMVMPEG